MFSYKKLIRDKLVDTAGVKTLFTAAATGSCRVLMEDLVVDDKFPQVLIGYGGGETTLNMSADSSQIYVTIEAQSSGSEHAYDILGDFRSQILSVLDDTALNSTTAVCYHLRKFGETESFDEERKVYWLRIGFNGEFKQNFSLP